MASTLGDVRVQQRGFGEIVFGDSKNERCSLKQSSAIDPSLDDPFLETVTFGLVGVIVQCTLIESRSRRYEST